VRARAPRACCLGLQLARLTAVQLPGMAMPGAYLNVCSEQ